MNPYVGTTQINLICQDRWLGYCFRHTYATFRLTEGVDVYFLSKQIGTSVKMIEARCTVAPVQPHPRRR